MVSNKELIERLEEVASARLELVRKKSANYAGGGEDANAFKNFDMIETLTNGKVSREVGMLVRMTDKLGRLATLMTGTDDTVGESIEDTLQDLANYADLTLVAWRDKDAIKRDEFEESRYDEHAFQKNFDLLEPEPTTENDPRSLLAKFFNKIA